MSKEKKEAIKRTAEKFIRLDEEMKDKIAWYMLGKEEERAKWEKKMQTS